MGHCVAVAIQRSISMSCSHCAVFCAKHSHMGETQEEITPHLHFDHKVKPAISSHGLLTGISHMVPGEKMGYEI